MGGDTKNSKPGPGQPPPDRRAKTNDNWTTVARDAKSGQFVPAKKTGDQGTEKASPRKAGKDIPAPSKKRK